MSIEKAEIKVGTAHEIGCRLDDVLEGTNKDLYRLEGAATAFRKGAESVETLAKAVEVELEKGEYDLEVAARLKRYISRAQQMLTNLAMNADNNRITQAGKVQAMQMAVGIVKKFKDAEESKINTLRQAMLISQGEAVSGEPRAAGLRPAMSIKERRIAEEAAQQTVEVAEAPVETQAEVQTTSEPPQPATLSEPPSDGSEPTVKRRGRKPKG